MSHPSRFIARDTGSFRRNVRLFRRFSAAIATSREGHRKRPEGLADPRPPRDQELERPIGQKFEDR
jgi:hypothetical protein